MFLAGIPTRPREEMYDKSEEEAYKILSPSECMLIDMPQERREALFRREGEPYRRGTVAFDEMTAFQKLDFLNFMLTRLANFVSSSELRSFGFEPPVGWHHTLTHLANELYDLYYQVTGTLRKVNTPQERKEEFEEPLSRAEKVAMVERFLSNNFHLQPDEIPIAGLERDSSTNGYILQEEEIVRRAEARILSKLQTQQSLTANDMAEAFVERDEPQATPQIDDRHSPGHTPQRYWGSPEPTYSPPDSPEPDAFHEEKHNDETEPTPVRTDRETGNGGGFGNVSNIRATVETAENRPNSAMSGLRIGEATHPGPSCSKDTPGALECENCEAWTTRKCGICKIEGFCDECVSYLEYCQDCAPHFAHYRNMPPFRNCTSCQSLTQDWCSRCRGDTVANRKGVPYCSGCASEHPHCNNCREPDARITQS